MTGEDDEPKAVTGEVFVPGEQLPKSSGEGEGAPGVFSRARTWIARKNVEEETRLAQAHADLTRAYAEGAQAKYDFDLAVEQLGTVSERAAKMQQEAINDRKAEENREKEIERQALEEEARHLEAERLRQEEEDRQQEREQRGRIRQLELELQEAELKARLAKLNGVEKPDEQTPLDEIQALDARRREILDELEQKRADGTLTPDEEREFGEMLQRIQKKKDEATRKL